MGNVTETEKELIYTYIFNGLILDRVNQNIEILMKNEIGFKIPEVHENFFRSVLKKIQKERDALHKYFRTNKIKVYEGKPIDEMFFEWEYYARGYKNSQKIWVAAIDLEIKRRSTQYFRGHCFYKI